MQSTHFKKFRAVAGWMPNPQSKSERKKVNFLVNEDLITEVNLYIPSGRRSDFVNQALEEAMIRYKRKKAFEDMDSLREEAKLHLSNKEIIRLKNEGRP